MEYGIRELEKGEEGVWEQLRWSVTTKTRMGIAKTGGTDWRGLYGVVRTKKCLQGASRRGGGSKKRNGTRDNRKGTCKIKQ
jgi:hypothetical protein